MYVHSVFQKAFHGAKQIPGVYQDLFWSARRAINTAGASLEAVVNDALVRPLSTDAAAYWRNAHADVLRVSEERLISLREQQHTGPGASLIKSALTTIPVYYAAGGLLAPIAEDLAGLLPGLHAEVTAWGTFAAQLVPTYGTFAALQAAQEPDQFRHVSGRVRKRDVAKYGAQALLSLAPVEFVYGLGKTYLHTKMMENGMPEGPASMLADGLALPVWFAGPLVPLGYAANLVTDASCEEATGLDS